jgi:hypothetical protein
MLKAPPALKSPFHFWADHDHGDVSAAIRNIGEHALVKNNQQQAVTLKRIARD